MKQSEIVAEVANRTGQSQTKVRAALKEAVDVMKESLIDGRDIKLPGFCTLVSTKTKPRRYFDPVRKEYATSVPKRVVKVRLTKSFKDAVAEMEEE